MTKFLKVLGAVFLFYSIFFLISLYGFSYFKINSKSKEVLNDKVVSLENTKEKNLQYTEVTSLHSTIEGALQLRIDLINEAKNNLLISQYSIGDDDSGLLFISAIEEAAKRGVEVKLLINHFSNDLSKNSYLSVLDSYENVEIKVVGGFNILKPWEINNVLHDKLIIVDNDYFLSSGRNVNDRFIFKKKAEAAVNDLDILIKNIENEKNPILINEGKMYYQELWEADYAKNKKKQQKSKWFKKTNEFARLVKKTKALHNEELGEEVLKNKVFYSIDNGFLSHNSTNEIVKKPQVWNQMTHFMNEAEEEFKLVSPYVVIDKTMKKFIKKNNNIELELYTNSKSNSPNVLAFSGYLSQKKLLLKQAKIWELQTKNSNHQKAFVTDDSIVGVGSMNSDPRSVYFSSENLLIVKSKGLSSELKEVITDYEKESLEVKNNSQYEESESAEEASISIIKKVLLAILSLFSPLFRFML